MEINFLGTGAAELFLDENRFKVDDNIRRYTTTLLDQKLLIDCGPHVIDSLKLFNNGKCLIENVLLTHNHGDHFNLDSLKELKNMCANTLHVYKGENFDIPEIDGIYFHNLNAENEYKIGDFSVIPLSANHIKGALHYSIEKDGKNVFYGCDGAWLLYDTYYYMKDNHYDLMILDATVGNYEGDFRMAEHNSIPMIRSMMKSFKTVGIVKEDTKIVLDHLAHSLHKPHKEICELVKKDGFIVAYDGMKLDI